MISFPKLVGILLFPVAHAVSDDVVLPIPRPSEFCAPQILIENSDKNLKSVIITAQSGERVDPEIIIRWRNDKEAGLAVQRTSEGYHLFFNQPGSVDMPQRIDDELSFIDSVNIIATDPFLIIQIKMKDDLPVPIISMRESKWYLTWPRDCSRFDEKEINNPLNKINVYLPDAATASLDLEISKSCDPIKITDPHTFVEYWVVPTKNPNVGEDYLYTSFVTIYETLQGAVIELASQDVNLKKRDKVVSICSSKSLEITPKAIREMKRTISNVPSILHVSGGKKFSTQRSEYYSELVGQGPAERLHEELELAKLFMNDGQYFEAEGILQHLLESHPIFKSHPYYRTLSSIALTLQGSYVEALAYHNVVYPNNDAERDFWYALAHAGLVLENADPKIDQVKRDAYLKLRKNPEMIKQYPPIIQSKAFRLISEIILLNNDLEFGEKLVAANIAAPSDEDVAFHHYFEARLAMMRGYDDKALSLLKELEAQKKNINIAMRAAFTRIKHQLDAKEITVDKALKDIDRFKYDWRGGKTEYQKSKYLAELYKRNHEYHKALELMDKLQKYFPHEFSKDSLFVDMQSMYKDFFLKNSKKESALTLLGVYEMYHHLLPEGSDGDAIVLKVIDELLTLDLLDKAIELLTVYTEKKPASNDKVRLYHRIAKAYLDDENPLAAITILSKSQLIPMQPEQQQVQSQLHARAMMAEGRFDVALEFLSDINSFDGLKLKADIYMKTKQWDKSLPILKDLIQRGEKNENGRDKAKLIMTAATAAVLAGQAAEVLMLREQHKEFMDKTHLASAFDLATTPDHDVVSNENIHGSIKEKLKAVGDMSKFIKQLEAQAKESTSKAIDKTPAE